ncbi:shufflon system plasmid conjugative transfer pilus tip adhesin PilV, partial [Escherichia coli]
PAVITTTMLKNTGFLSSGFTETNSEGQRLQAYVVRNAQNPELLQAMVVSSGGTPYPVKALIQMAKDITTGLGGYIQDGKTATGALRSWSVALSNYGAKSGNGHIAVLLSTDELSGAAEDTDRLYRFQVNGRPDLNKMHTAIDMGSNNLNNVGAVNAQTGNFSGNVNGVNGTFSGQVKGNSGNFDVNVTAGGDIRSNNGWLITRNSKGWLNETHGGGFYMSDGSWVRSVNNKGIYTGGQVKGGTVRADGRLYTGEYLQLERTAVAGASCSPNGLVGRDNTGAILSCQSGTWGAPKIQFTTQTYNIAKNTRNLRLGVHAYCSWTYLNGSPFGGFQQVYSDQNNVWYVSNYAWGNYESGGTISVTCLNLPGAGA